MAKRKNIVRTLQRQVSQKKDLHDDGGHSDESQDKGSGDAEAIEEFDVEEFVKFVDGILKYQKIPYKCSAPTPADGNCWWRAMAVLLGMEGEDAHITLRTQVCANVKNCPRKWIDNVVDINFKEKRKGLTDLVYRQKEVGRYTDDKGVVTQATAFYTKRDIHVFSETGGSVPTVLECGHGVDNHEPLAVFFNAEHYQALVPIKEQEDK